MRIEVKVLGPLVVDVDGMSIVPTANKPSQVLALLALNAGNVVTVGALTEELWDHQPPATAMSTLQTYVFQLRRKLQHALADQGDVSAKDILITRRSGYLLDIRPDEVDAAHYNRLSAAGRAAVNQGDHETASRVLDEALRLWRGPALADIPTGPVLAIETRRLGENRLADLHLRIAADLRLGRHHQLLGELATLCAQHPLLENFCALHMVALYRSGRQSQALQAYQRLRSSMVEQLGVEPSARMRQLHHAMLSGHAVLDDRTIMFTS